MDPPVYRVHDLPELGVNNPFQHLQQYLSKLPNIGVDDECKQRLWLKPNPFYKDEGASWYCKQPIGKGMLAKRVKDLFPGCTTQSYRVGGQAALDKENVAPQARAAHTGHHSIEQSMEYNCISDHMRTDMALNVHTADVPAPAQQDAVPTAAAQCVPPAFPALPHNSSAPATSWAQQALVPSGAMGPGGAHEFSPAPAAIAPVANPVAAAAPASSNRALQLPAAALPAPVLPRTNSMGSAIDLGMPPRSQTPFAPNARATLARPVSAPTPSRDLLNFLQQSNAQFYLQEAYFQRMVFQQHAAFQRRAARRHAEQAALIARSEPINYGDDD